MPLSPGTRIGPYEIVAPLGAGGMGEVYLARDSRLERDVAVKVLPQHLADDPQVRGRFEREARTVSALNHPHICTVHDVGVHAGLPYLVMERLTGRSLADLTGGTPLPVDRVIALGGQIADALDAAHRAGIVHRDLKPGNLFVTERGDAKVLDFGLARMDMEESRSAETDDAATVGAQHVTQAGSTLGTVAYMSPEQSRGERVDARSDLWSLGVVLYQMVTGRLPFEGKSNAELFAGILKSDPTPPCLRNPQLPVELDAIILRALEKDPARRFATAAELREALMHLQREGVGPSGASVREASGAGDTIATRRRGHASPSGSRRGRWVVVTVGLAVLAVAAWGFWIHAHKTGDAGRAGASTPAGVPEHSIAVLPFTDMSPGKDQEYFSDGISEELLNLLAKVPQLQVIARTSSFSFKGKQVGIPEIAKQLHVGRVLEGSVRKAGNKVRITAQLIDATTDTHLWSQTYDRTLDDVFAIQEEIAADVVQQLKIRLLAAAPKVRETRPEAYPLFLEAIQRARSRTGSAYAKSDSLLQQVLALDPAYAPAWAHLASNRVNEVSIGMVPREQGFRSAREAASKALEIDPEFARAHASLGSIAIFSGDLAGAAQHFERAIALDPTDLVVLGNSSAVLKSLGRLPEALAMDEAVVRRDPVNAVWLFNLGCAQNWAGQYDQAITSLRSVLSLSPEYAGTHLVLGEALLHKGDPAAALAEIEKESSDPFRMIGLPMAYHALGRKAASDSTLAALTAQYGNDAPYDIAYVHAVRGESDRAFAWLDRAAAVHDPSLTLVLVENLFDSLHSDPRWPAFLHRLGKGQETLATIPFKVSMGTGS
jgi:TolB-like protein/cytochrome c-type biogenesis protein CcmH/NrfG/alkylated DNA nucleotide flippase Atl1